jgi:serine/threonine-protein kinase
LVRGVTWNALWISVFAAAVPASFGKMALASVTAALMGPLGFAVATVINQNPVPPTEQLALILLPNFVAAGWAIPASRHLHSLGAQVSKERAMGSYQLVEPIGRGGMGEVWKAKHRMLARTAAIKLIRPEVLAADDLLVRRFEREARAIAGLRSPHTVALYDFGSTDDGRFYYVMELLQGFDLEALVDRFGPLPPPRVAYLLKQVCKSLSEAHQRGLVHRDIKPRNLFSCHLGTDYDFVKVLDFGLVKSMVPIGDTLTQLTAGVVTGTPAYMAPEAATGTGEVDGRADLYAVGCVAHWLLTGHTLFSRDSPMAMLLAHVQEMPDPPSRRSRQPVPASLDRIVMSCLEKDPARRPQTAAELYAHLSECDCGEPWTPEGAAEWWRRHVDETEFTTAFDSEPA